MSDKETDAAKEPKTQKDKTNAAKAEERRSYLERLKKKIGKLKEEDPNIYPLW